MYQGFSTSGDARGERAVTEVLGAILVFGLVLAVLALVQVSGIPAANEQVEFEHSQRVAGDFQSLDENVDAAGTRGSLGSTGIEAGVRYPNRLFFINPGPVGGSLASEQGSVSLTGLTGTAADEASDYDLSTESFITTGLSYSANYNEYANAPTVHYENGVLFERYVDDNGDIEDVVIDGGSLVSGRRITVVTVEGDFSTQVPDELPINVVPVSAGTKAVTVDANANAQISIETVLSENTWRNILSSELASNQVTGVACTSGQSDPDLPCDGTLTIDLADDVYDLRMAKVGLTTNDNQNPAADFDEEAARYIVAESTTSISAVAGQSVEVTAEVRDRFNNPVSGETVTFAVTGGGASIDDSDPVRETNVEGIASVRVDTLGATSPVTVEAEIDDGSSDDEFVTFEITLVNADPNGNNTDLDDTLSTINDADAPVFISKVDLKNTVSTPQGGEDSGLPDTFRVTMENRKGSTQTVEQARLSFLLAEEDALYVDVVDKGDLANSTDDELIGRLYLTDSFAPIGPIAFDPTETKVVDFVFYEYADPSEVPNTAGADWETNLVGQNGKSDTFATLSMVVVSQGTGAAGADEVQRQTAFVAVSTAEPEAFLDATIESIPVGQNQEHDINFMLGRGLETGESITIDLAAAETAGVNYNPGTAFDAGDASGDVTYDESSNTLTFEATGSGVTGATTVSITASGVNVNANNDDIPVTFTRHDLDESVTVEFDVTP